MSEKSSKEWTQDRVKKCFDELGFLFPKTEEELKAFDEKFKDYPFKADEKKIDPIKILKSIKMSKELSAQEFFETEKPLLNNFDPVENVVTYGKLDMFEWAERFAAARLESVKTEIKKLDRKHQSELEANDILLRELENVKKANRYHEQQHKRLKGRLRDSREQINGLKAERDELREELKGFKLAEEHQRKNAVAALMDIGKCQEEVQRLTTLLTSLGHEQD